MKSEKGKKRKRFPQNIPKLDQILGNYKKIVQ